MFTREELHSERDEQHDFSTHYVGHFARCSDIPDANRIRSKSLLNINNIVQLIAKFILDCLGNLPCEFWSIAADIMLSGLRAVTKNCYSAILHARNEAWQLCMLHNVGLSQGVAEWVEGCHETCPTEYAHANREIYSSSCHTSSVPEGHRHEKSNILNTADEVMMNERSNSFHGLENKVVATDNENQKVLDHIGTKDVVGEMYVEEAALVIETIRREEFDLDQTISYADYDLLNKQHARLGRALLCLSKELYSQDSHIILELIQNADDNIYPENVEPTLVFVLQEDSIAVLNNESGFSAENIRALCDIGNSTKKGSNRGYIGNKYFEFSV